MVIDSRNGGSAVAISLACQQPGQGVIAARHDISSSVRKGGNAVERIVACVLVGFIRISLAGGQPRSGVVSPGRHVSIRSFSRISRDGFRGTTERRQAGNLVRIVVREHGWLNRRSPFGLLASPGVIGITGRLAHGVGDAGRLVQRLPVGIGRAVFRGIRHGKEAQGCIVHFRRGIAAAVRIGHRHALGRIGAALAGGDSCIIGHSGGKTVHGMNHGNIRYSGLGHFPHPGGRFPVFRPIGAVMPPGVRRNHLAFQHGVQ